MTSKMQAMLDELAAHVERARQHEDRMRTALAESATWAISDDRDWILGAVDSATQEREAAEKRLAQSRRIVASLRYREASDG